MIGKEELHNDLLTELHETYKDVSSGKLTLTRIYVLVTICGLVAFAILCVSMLFAMQFAIALVYAACSVFCYCLLRFRRRRFIARHFDWLAVITSHCLTIIAISINVYLYGSASGSQLFLFAMVAILYIIALDKAKKRFFVTLIVFIIDLISFWVITFLDFHMPNNPTTSLSSNGTFIVSSVLAMGISVAPVWISKLMSIGDIEKLTILEEKQLSYANEEFYGCLSKKALDNLVATSDGELYKDLNICLLEVVIGLKRNEVVRKVNDFYFSRVLKEFATLLRCYFTDAKFLVRYDSNTFLIIFERDYESSYRVLSNIMDSFDQKIRAENDTLEIYLRISGKNYRELDTRKRPRLLLDRINELMRIKHDSSVLGQEYLLMSTDVVHSSRYRSDD